MTFKINSWSDIRENFNGTIVLGNGASMATSQKFSYKSLLDHVTKSEALADDIHRLFSFFNTSDFELILRIVWQATNVNKSLGIVDARTQEAYLRVRECLIKAVREVHPEHDEVSESLPKIYEYLKNFDTVISLNYDLITYWATTYGLDIEDGHAFKDCFISGKFNSDWQRFKKPIGREKKSHSSSIHTEILFCAEIRLKRKRNFAQKALASWNQF